MFMNIQHTFILYLQLNPQSITFGVLQRKNIGFLSKTVAVFLLEKNPVIFDSANNYETLNLTSCRA